MRGNVVFSRCFFSLSLKRREVETDFTHQLVHHADTGVSPTITNLSALTKDLKRSDRNPCALNDSVFPRNQGRDIAFFAQSEGGGWI